MKFLLTISTGILLMGSLTGCCYQSAYCDPLTGTNYGGYWTPTCGGPLDPLGVNCRSYGNSYGQCVENKNQSCDCENGHCQIGRGECCEQGTYTGANGCGNYSQPMYQQSPQQRQKVTPANPEPAPPELPKSNGEDKSASSGMTPVPQARQPVAPIREARRSYGIPATFN